MKPLSRAVDDYLQLRRGLGFKLRDTGHYLPDFVRFLDDHGASYITTQLAIRWATLPGKARPSHWARRLTMVRLFALHWKAHDPRTEVPPAGAISETTSASASVLRSFTTTAAPSAARRRAMARPIPPPAPVTTATLP